jgi:hypothetical protein
MDGIKSYQVQVNFGLAEIFLVYNRMTSNDLKDSKLPSLNFSQEFYLSYKTITRGSHN